MNHLPYRAIALDLDGTLTNHDKVVTPKTREALLQAEAEGVVIILASGRPTYGIEPVAECLELDKRGGYILSYNGGNIVNAKTGEKLFAQFLPDAYLDNIGTRRRRTMPCWATAATRLSPRCPTTSM